MDSISTDNLILIVLIGICLYFILNKNERFTLPGLGPLYMNNNNDTVLNDMGLKNITKLYCPDDKVLYNGLCFDKTKKPQDNRYNLIDNTSYTGLLADSISNCENV